MIKILAILLAVALFPLLLIQPAFANAPGPNLDGTYDPNPTGTILILVLYLIIIAFTCFVEWLVCIPFQLHYVYTSTILLTNVITQLIMHCLEWLLMAILPATGIDVIGWYAITVAVLELAVIITEYLIYRKNILALSKGACLFYVLSANAASAFGGILLLLIIIF